MRLIRICTMLGVLAALTVPAGAVGIPFSQAWNGPLVWHITNWEDSVVYDYNGGFLADGVTPIVLGTPYAAASVKVDATQGSIALDPSGTGETSWGIFQVDQILSGSISGPNSISTGALTLYDKGASSTDILGIFYGAVDQTVTFNSAISTTITASGFNYEIFTQPDTIYDPTSSPALGAGARVDENEWSSLVGYDGTGANKLLAGAERVLTAVGQPGMTAQEFLATFDLSQITGTFDTYLSVAPLTEAFDSTGASVGFSGSQNVNYDTDVFPTLGYVPVVPGTTADFRLKGTSEPTFNPWLVRSSDPVTTAFVPEPVTMLGLVLGVGGLAGYIRKRRTA